MGELNTEQLMLEEHEHLTAEAFFLSYFRSLLNEQGSEYADFFIACEGSANKGKGQAVSGLDPRVMVRRSFDGEGRPVDSMELHRMLGLRISRDGIYDLLPEALFFPLTLGDTMTSTKEKVHRIRENRQREKNARLFFAPFDTEFFWWKTAFLELQLTWPREIDREQIAILLQQLTGRDWEFDSWQALPFISLLAHAEAVKENPGILEKFLANIFKCKVHIREAGAPVMAPPAVPLGQTRLSVDSVLAGSACPEGTDWIVDMVFSKAPVIDVHVREQKLKQLVTDVLEYFAGAEREIIVRFHAETEAQTPALGRGVLGINSYLAGSNGQSTIEKEATLPIE